MCEIFVAAGSYTPHPSLPPRFHFLYPGSSELQSGVNYEAVAGWAVRVSVVTVSLSLSLSGYHMSVSDENVSMSSARPD